MQGGPFDVTFVDVPGLEISSRDIRARIQEGRAWRHFVPQPVTDYIFDEGLYGVEEFRRAHAGQQALVAEQETLYMPRVLHGITAAAALGRDFPQIPQDVLQAIARHTVAAEHMEPLDMVLYIADAIEPNRQFGRIDELRARVGKATLEELYFETYEYWVFLLFERRKPLHPDTIRI